jgi:hypothetical protein
MTVNKGHAMNKPSKCERCGYYEYRADPTRAKSHKWCTAHGTWCVYAARHCRVVNATPELKPIQETLLW